MYPSHRALKDRRYAAALDAYYRAEYDAALAIAESLTPPTYDVHILRSKAFRRSDRAEEAIQSARSAIEVSAPGEDRTLAVTLLAAAQITAGAIDQAEGTLSSLGRGPIADRFVRAELGFTRSLLAFIRNDFKRSELKLREAYRDHSPAGYARTIQMQAYITGGRGDYLEQCRLFARALDVLKNAKPMDVALRAMILYGFAMVLWELPFGCNLMELRAALREITWTKALDSSRYWTHRCLGLRMAFEGGLGVTIGLQLLRRSVEYASTTAQRVLALLDSAYVAFAAGEPLSGSAALADADELATLVDWSAERGDERLALVMAAELFASRNPERAQHYLDLYRATPMAPRMALGHDNRVDGMIAHVEGVMARHRSDVDKAVDRLGYACELFSGIRYDWRAALAAVELYEITKRVEYHERAAHLVRSYPNSWLAARIGLTGMHHDARYQSLTTAEKKVFELLAESCGSAEIATRLAKSPKTINNHIAAIYRKWKVHSQRQLLSTVRALRLPDKAKYPFLPG